MPVKEQVGDTETFWYLCFRRFARVRLRRHQLRLEAQRSYSARQRAVSFSAAEDFEANSGTIEPSTGESESSTNSS